MEVVIYDEENTPDLKTGIYEKSNGGTERMYRTIMERLPKELTDKFQIICSRVREFEEDKIPILYCHDVWNDPESAHLADLSSRLRFRKIVFVSNYQFNTYNQGLGVPYSQSFVLKNAIDPISRTVEKQYDKIRLIYHTTPHRGLEILVPIFCYLAEKNPDIHLDVFSSFNLYGWPERDAQYEELFNICREHPQITYHGAVPNDQVREALKQAHIFAYPSIWPETSCIAAIEAMSAGCLVVAPDFAALPETISDFGLIYRWTENNHDHARRFAAMLMNAIIGVREKKVTNLLLNAQNRANSLFNWDVRIVEWTRFLEGTLNEKPGL